MTAYDPKDPRFAERVAEIFAVAPFIRDLGITLTGCGAGWCETELVVARRHAQQDGYVHAGVQATMADHTAGAAAGTLMGPDEIVLSVEFKVNLLRPGRAERLRCRAEVLRPGRTISVVESSVWGFSGEVKALLSKATVTLTFVPRPA